jgi:hypothetical protein
VAFKLTSVKLDRHTRRAHVELRDQDDDGSEIVATATFSFRTLKPLAQRQVEEEIVHRARHFLHRAAASRTARKHDLPVN